MAMLTIRNLDDDVKRRLRLRAAENDRSMEEEARRLLADALAQDPPRPRTGRELLRHVEAIKREFGPMRIEQPSRRDDRPIPFADEDVVNDAS